MDGGILVRTSGYLQGRSGQGIPLALPFACLDHGRTARIKMATAGPYLATWPRTVNSIISMASRSRHRDAPRELAERASPSAGTRRSIGVLGISQIALHCRWCPPHNGRPSLSSHLAFNFLQVNHMIVLR